MVRAKEQMQRAGDQDCNTKRSSDLACIFISFGGGVCLVMDGDLPLLQHHPGTAAARNGLDGLVAMSELGHRLPAMPSREFPKVRCNLSSHEPGTIREGMSVCVGDAAISRNSPSRRQCNQTQGQGLDRAGLPTCRDRVSSVQHPAGRAPRPSGAAAKRMIHLDRTAEVDRVMDPANDG